MSEELSEVGQIELSIKQAQAFLKSHDALLRLMKNDDFKEIILDGYFKEEPARLVQIKAAASMDNDKDQANILKSLDGIGSLQQYFHTIWIMADGARSAIQDGNEALDDMADEEGGA